MTPSKSTLDGGGYVVLKGLGFKAGLSVTVANAPAKNIVFVDKETVTFQVPSGRPGPADIVVINTDGGKGTFGQAMTYVASTLPAPTVVHVTPNSGPSSGGTYAAVDGTNFAPGAILLVAGAPAGTVSVLGATQLSARFPGHPGNGTGDVIVSNPDGQSGVLFGGFAFASNLPDKAPHLIKTAPTEGPLAGGNHVVVTIESASANGQLFVGGVPTAYAPAAGGVDVVMPAGRAHGLVDVAFTNADGQSDVLAGAYNYFEAKITIPPALARVTPGRAPGAGGGTVIVEGDGFAPGAQVLFGTAPATSVVVASAHVLTCVVPPNATGPVDVTVQNADGGIATFKAGFLYADSSAAKPTVVKATPNTGPATGGTVAEIVGTGFVNGAIVIVGGRPASHVTWDDPGTMVARFPAVPAGAADLTVTNPDGQSGTLRGAFAVAASVSTAAPRVNAVTPAGGPLEGGLPVFVSGDSFLPGALVFIGGHKAASAPQGSTVLVATLPSSANPGLAEVAVTNPDGQSDVLPGGFNFYVSAPVLSAISPNCGPAAGGTTVVISGRSLRGGITASIGGQPVTGLVRNDSSTLTGTTAQHAAGSVDVTVVNPDGQTDLLSGGFFYTDATHPCQNTGAASLALQRVVPGNGPTTGGLVITLVGGGFVPGATVKFGNAAAQDVRLLGSGALTCTLPAGSIGPTDVTISLPDGRSSRLPASFDYYNPLSNLPRPTLTGISPNAGPNTGHTTVLLTGSNFAAGARVFFGPTEASLPTVVDGGRLVAVTPNSLSGPVDVTVINVDGKSAVLPTGFAFYPSGAAGSPPLAQFVSPRTGSTLAPTTITAISGSGFQAGAQVFVGGVPATNVALNPDGSLAAVFPPQAAGTVDVTITNPDGQSSTITQGFTYSPPQPAIANISPAFGPVEGGTSVIITGAGFLTGDTVQFDTTNAAVKVLDNTALFASVPAHAAGIVNITLLRGGVQQDQKIAAFTYDPNFHPGPPPGIVSLQPATGPTSGGTVLWMTGQNFKLNMQVLFGGASAAKVIVADSSHAIVYSPPGAAGAADVTALNPDGQSTALLRGFAYVQDALLSGPAPSLTSATPSQGPESSATVDVMTGRNFVSGELVFVGNALGSGVKLLSTSILSATFPPQPHAVVDLAVTNPDGRSSVLPGGFTYLARPTIDKVVTSDTGAANGPTAGQSTVLVTGSGFLQGATVTFNRVPATNVQFQSGFVISCNTPAGAEGPADVQVTNPDGQFAVLTGGWLYVPPPVANLLYPSQGPAAGGTISVLTGTGFQSGSSVYFGGVRAQSVLYGSPTTLIVTSPAGTSGASAAVTVKNPDNQQSTLASKFLYTTPTSPAPTLQGAPNGPIAPSRGLDTGGTYATVTGTNFQQGVLAIVGALPLNRTALVDPATGTTITGVTQGGAIGPAMVAVTNPDGQSAMVAGAFAFTDHAVAGPPPAISSLVPASAPAAPAGQGVAINGTGFQQGVLIYMNGIPAPLNGTSGPTLVSVRTPAGEVPGRVDVVATNPDGQSFVAPLAFTFTIPPPQLTGSSVTPATGPTSGGTQVKITGSYFRPPVSVFFGDAQAVLDPSRPAPTDSTIYALTPGGLAGAVALRIVNSDGQQTTQAGAYTYLAPPVLLTVSPTSGPPEGGVQVHLTGRYFNVDTTDTSAVLFGQAKVTSIVTATPTDIVVVAPSTTAAGGLTVGITITNKDKQSVLVPGAFVYLPPAQPPVVNGITPAASTLAGNATVTVLGAHFQFGAKVYFGNWAGGADAGPPPPECTGETVQSDGALTCVVPGASKAGTVDVTLINPNGQYAVLPAAFTYVAGPPPAQLALQSIAPGAGDVGGGTAVIISGQGFLQGATASIYPAGNTSTPTLLSNIVVVGPTAITAKMPAQPAALITNYDVWVQNPGSAPAILAKAWTYGTGTRRWLPQGLRMPMESYSRKYNRGNGGRSTVAWQGVAGDFTHSVTGATDVISFGWNGRNPRLLQGSVDPQGTNAVSFRDVTATNLRNADLSPMRDNVCWNCNYGNRSYQAFEPRVFSIPQLNSWPSVAFWDDQGAFTILWNSNGVLTAQDYGNSPNNWGVNDWVGGGNDMTGKFIDFNLDGYADFAFAGEGRNWLMLSCGTGYASPYCGGYNLPTMNTAVSPGTTAIGPNAGAGVLQLTATYLNYGALQVGTQLIVDQGASQEVITLAAGTGGNLTTTFRFAHPAGTVVGPYIKTTSTTQVTSVPANGSGVDVTLALASTSNVGLWNYEYLILDAGTDQEEILGLPYNPANYANNTVVIHVYKTHTLAGGMTVGTLSPRRFVPDTVRFIGDTFGYAYTMVAGDIDSNGAEDLITGHPATAGSIHVWLNNAKAMQTANPDGTAYNFTFTEATSTTFSGNPPNANIHSLAYFPTVPGTPGDLLVGYDNSPGSGATGQQERLYLNQGLGKYANSTTVAMPANFCTQSARIPTNETDAILRYEIADIDGNGALDVLAWIDVNTGLPGTTTQKILKLWLNDGKGCFFGQSQTYGASAGQIDTLFPNNLPMAYQHILGDLNKDGLPDLILPVDRYQSREYINQTGSFADKTVYNLPDSRPLLSATNVWMKWSDGAALIDVNGDKFPDLIVGQRNTPVESWPPPLKVNDTDGSIRLFLNDQKGNFPVDNSLTNLPTQTVNGKVASALPFSTQTIDSAKIGVPPASAGQPAYPGPDLLIGNMSRWSSAATFPYPTSSPYYGYLYNGSLMGSVRLLLNQPDASGNPTGVFTDATYPRLPTNGATFLYAAQVKFVDLNNDGFPDIVIGRGDAQAIKIWQNTGTGYFVDVTNTAVTPSEDYIPPNNNCNWYISQGVRDIKIANFDGDNLNLQDVLVGGECGTRLLINHSDPVSKKIYLVDETEGAIARMPSPPTAHSIVVGDFSCDGSPDLYIIDTGGHEHVLINSACTTGGPCGFFTDVSTTYLPPASQLPGAGCGPGIGADNCGNQKAIGLSYDSSNTDILISRYSDDDNYRPYRLLKNSCGGVFKELSLASWQPFPFSNDKTYGVLGGDIFGRHDKNTDLLFLNEYGPRIYMNSP